MNRRPPAPKAGALPSCATPRLIYSSMNQYGRRDLRTPRPVRHYIHTVSGSTEYEDALSLSRSRSYEIASSVNHLKVCAPQGGPRTHDNSVNSRVLCQTELPREVSAHGAMSRARVHQRRCPHLLSNRESPARADWIRTSGLLVPNEARYQTAPQPVDQDEGFEPPHRGPKPRVLPLHQP